MKHQGTMLLTTNHLILRQFDTRDAKDMFNNWAHSDDVTKYLCWPTHDNIQVTENYIHSLVDNYIKKDYYNWAIVLKGLNQAIGSISIVRQDDFVQSAHIGYCIGKLWWGKGYVTEAFSEIIRYLMIDIGFNRIESRYDPRNIASGKVMEKCGLKYEGTLRASDHNNQGICDAAWYGLLRSDYMRLNP